MDNEEASVFHDWLIEFLESHQFQLKPLKGKYGKKQKMIAIRKHPKGRQVEVLFTLKPMMVHVFTHLKIWTTIREPLQGFLDRPVMIDLVKDRSVSQVWNLTEKHLRQAWNICNKPLFCSRCGTIKVLSQNSLSHYCSALCWLDDREKAYILNNELKLKPSANMVL